MTTEPAGSSRRTLLVALVVLALLGVGLIGVSGYRLYQRWRAPAPSPRETDVSKIEPWMTVGYVARAYRVPPPELFRALGITPDEFRRRSIEEVAQEQGRSADEVLATVRRSVASYQAIHPDTPRKPGELPRPRGFPPRGPAP